VKVHKGEYSTDLVKEKALDYLDTALDGDRPFFLGIAPIACHSCKRSHAIGGRDALTDPLAPLRAVQDRHQARRHPGRHPGEPSSPRQAFPYRTAAPYRVVEPRRAARRVVGPDTPATGECYDWLARKDIYSRSFSAGCWALMVLELYAGGIPRRVLPRATASATGRR
jgi:hypothetical protein